MQHEQTSGQPQKEPYAGPPQDEPPFGQVDWDDDTDAEDGTAYLQRLNPDGEGGWETTDAFLLICNVGPGGISDPDSHIIDAHSSATREPQEFLVASVVGSSQTFDNQPTALDGMQAFLLWFYVPSTDSWIIQQFVNPDSTQTIVTVGCTHTIDLGADIIQATINSMPATPETYAGTPSPQAPAYMAAVNIGAS